MRRDGDVLDFVLCLLAAMVITASLVWCIFAGIEKEEQFQSERLDAQISPERRAEIMKGVGR